MTVYDKDEILKIALAAIQENSLFCVKEVVMYLPISRSTFYAYFPDGSDGLDTIKEAVDNVKVKKKVKLRNNWEYSDNATLQMGYMKMVCTDEEWQRLSGSRTENKTELSTKTPINLKELFGFESDTP